MKLTVRETATVLAALRLFRETYPDKSGDKPNLIHFDACSPLTDAQIDDLCRRFNGQDCLLVPRDAELEVAVHVFESGQAIYPYWRTGHQPSLATLRRAFDIDFDEQSGTETIDIQRVSLDRLPSLGKDPSCETKTIRPRHRK